MVFRKKQPAPAPAAVQLRQTERHPFGMLESYVPLSRGEDRLYRAVREAVPVVDAAIYKLIRLVGGVSARCDDPAAQRELETFLRTVAVGRGQFGINAFLDCYLDSLLTCGRAVGEIVPAAGNREIAAALIKEQCEAYILDKAAARGITLEAEIRLSGEGQYPYPTGVTLYGQVSQSDREAISAIIAGDLGIPRESQEWSTR